MFDRLKAHPDSESLTLVAKQLWIGMTRRIPEVEPIVLTAQDCLELVLQFNKLTKSQTIGLGIDLTRRGTNE